MTPGIAVKEREAVREALAPLEIEGPQCRHHWLIESPHGATSWGTCKHCGARREFSNSATDALWDGEGVPGNREEPVAAYTTQVAADEDGF